MRQSLEGAAVRGKIVLSPEQRQILLAEGDIEGLLELHHSMFGSAVMEDDKEDDESEDEDDTDDSDDGDEDDEDDEDEDEEGKAKKTDPKDIRIQELSAEGKKKRLRIRDQRARIAELEAQLAKGVKKVVKKVEPEDDGKDDTTKLEADNSNLTRTNEDLLIRLEFMANNKHSWKNPMAALKVLDLSDVEINDDGEVEGLDEAIEELVKSDPYLLDTSKQDKDEKVSKRRGPTGQPTGGSRKGNPNRDKLINKYPALRR